MKLLTKELIQELLSAHQAPCLSLYMPTHHQYPANLEDIILFKNLIRKMEESLMQKYSTIEVQKHLEPIKALVNSDNIWNHTLNGLAVFSADGIFKVVKLHKSVEELAIVADSFHTKPLRQYLQSLDHFHVLGLTLNDIRIFEGNRHSLSEVHLSFDSSKTSSETPGSEWNEMGSTDETYDNTGIDISTINHGHGGKNEESEKDAEKYFRAVSKTIYKYYSKPSGWPLILAALPEHHKLFQRVNKNPLLLSKGIAINPSAVSPDTLAKMAWEVMEPEYNLNLETQVERFEQARANGKGSDDIREVVVAAVAGRVDTLIVEADRIIAARVTNMETGNTQKKDITNPKVDDLLDDLGELVIRMGGQLIVLPTDKMPSETGLAAIYRY